MYDAKQLPSQRNDDFHSNLDSAFLIADVPNVLCKGVDEDDVLGNDKTHDDQAEKIEFETLLDVAERVQCGRRQALAVGRRGGTEGGRGRDSVEHEGVIILPLNPLIAIALSWFL